MLPYQSFFTSERIDELWANVKWLLFFIAPGIMIVIALYAVGFLVSTIIKSIRAADDDDDEDDYEVREY